MRRDTHLRGLLPKIRHRCDRGCVSWSNIHDHFKASLISSGDEQVGDTVIRATYHHNYFHDCGSRLPSIRFGRAHVFDNYYFNNTTGSCVDSRMAAVAKAESNYFSSSRTRSVGLRGRRAATGMSPTTPS